MRSKALTFFLVLFLAVILVDESLCAETRVISCSKDVKLIKEGSHVGVFCERNAELHKGDWISTGKNAEAEIAFNEDASRVVKVKGNSIMIIKDNSEEDVELLDGEIISYLGDVSGENFAVKTPAGVCGATETGWATSTSGSETNVRAFNNNVSLQGINADGSVSGDTYVVEEGYKRKIVKFNPPEEPVKIPDSELAALWDEIKIAEDRGYIEDDDTDGLIELNGVGVSIKSISTGSGFVNIDSK